MIADLKPYPEYKESGLPWLGQVPGHWTVETLRRLLRSGDGIKIGPFGSQLKLAHMSESGFKVYGQANVIAGDIRRGSKFVDEAKFEQLRECEVRPGDLLVTMMGTSGRCMVVPGDAAAGLMDSHLLRLRLRANGVGPVFTSLAIDQGPYVKRQVEMAGKGSIMHGLNSGMVKNLALVIPPPAEQAAIVRFLDWAKGRLERAIRAKRKVIALLTEQKQAIIHRAVTRGLDPSALLKPSGIPWLGDIPSHWEVRPLKAVCQIQSGITLGKDYSGQQTHEFPYLRVANVQAGFVNLSVVKTIRVPTAEAQRCLLDKGDVLMTEGGDPDKLGRGCVWDAQVTRCLHQNHIFAVRPNQLRLEPQFLAALMGTSYARAHFQSTAKQTTNLAATNKTKIGQLKVLLPTVSQQKKILVVLIEETRPVNTAILRLAREIELLREYRTRLVADVVTGKLDVREAATRLPEETAPDTTEDATNWSDETEPSHEEAAA